MHFLFLFYLQIALYYMLKMCFSSAIICFSVWVYYVNFLRRRLGGRSFCLGLNLQGASSGKTNTHKTLLSVNLDNLSAHPRTEIGLILLSSLFIGPQLVWSVQTLPNNSEGELSILCLLFPQLPQLRIILSGHNKTKRLHSGVKVRFITISVASDILLDFFNDLGRLSFGNCFGTWRGEAGNRLNLSIFQRCSCKENRDAVDEAKAGHIEPFRARVRKVLSKGKHCNKDTSQDHHVPQRETTNFKGRLSRIIDTSSSNHSRLRWCPIIIVGHEKTGLFPCERRCAELLRTYSRAGRCYKSIARSGERHSACDNKTCELHFLSPSSK
mmetsp:Transcript_12706/g.26397  ORF Transcript_12706/g.26397 Transcript_12706/m.26397 type:complete len:326 (+) Transcript_12706:34-1011(+)